MKYLPVSFLVFFVLISCSLISITHCADRNRNISKEEADDIEIERQLKILNKKPVKTIITEVGDVIDCIDIYKQPAFDNPLLKDHKLKMSPSIIPSERTNKYVSSSAILHGLQKERCPSGTVPIRRTTKKELLNAKYFTKKSKSIYANSNPNIGYHFVTAEEVVQGKRYFGAAASISIHNLQVDPDQFSTSQIWITNATDQENNSIEFGIMKYPVIFGDSLTRLFGSWSIVNGPQVRGCYNILCQGFVQVSFVMYFGQTFLHSSTYGQVSYEIYLKVSRDQKGNWWVSAGPNAGATENIGYWPNEILTRLRSSASTVRYGGYVGATVQEASPPMGNGHFPQLGDYKKTAWMRLMKYTNEAGNLVNLDPHLVRTTAPPQCYDIMFAGLLGNWGITMAYGGPGGICN
ncbi:hypothetical protein MKW92_009226 [Papaver armeniacum]|nr:hypothetical protein MKW92_009226 [Papaver armeniacum]